MDFKMPELGEGVHEGELVAWKVKVGDEVQMDQVLVEIMTDKATVEVPSPFSGTVEKLHVKEGETIEVNQVVLTFQSKDGQQAKDTTKVLEEKTPEKPKPAPQVAAPKQEVPAASQPVLAASSSAPVGDLSVDGRVLAAPSTRRFARERGVELASVMPSGPAGRVLREDVEKVLAQGASVAGAPMLARSTPMGERRVEKVTFKGLRKQIAKKMRESKDHAAHFTYVEEADATALVELRKQAKEMGAKQGVKVTYLPFIMKAMVATLREFPILNSELDEANGQILLKHYYNIGLSVQTDAGLSAPVVHDVDKKSVIELAREIQDKVDRARTNKLTMDDFKDSTITLTNAGSIGGLFATPVINYPEVAILGFNKIFRKPVAKMVDGKEQVVVRDWTYFSISLDHRIVDGAVGAEFMNRFIQYIENPALLMMA